MDTKGNYFEWIDVAKGIGIILVIAGHTFCLGLSSPLYTFHLPLFFLLSGLVFNELKYHSCSLILSTKAKQILRPWSIIALISLMVCLCIPEWRQELSIKIMLKEIYTTNTNNIQNSSLWYLLCLYMMFVMYSFTRKLSVYRYRAYFLIAVALLLLFIKHPITILSGYYLHLPDNRLPFKMDTASVALIFFTIGIWYKKYIMEIASKKKSWLVIAFLSIIVYVAGKINGCTNLNSYDFGRIPFLFYPIAFMGIITVIWCSNKVVSSEGLDRLSKVLKFYGKNSLIIFGFQSLFIRLYLLFFNHLQGLDMQLYQNYEFYHQIGAFIVVTFVMSPLMVIALQWLSNKGIRIL